MYIFLLKCIVISDDYFKLLYRGVTSKEMNIHLKMFFAGVVLTFVYLQGISQCVSPKIKNRVNNLSVCEYMDVVIEVDATGDSLIYTWQAKNEASAQVINNKIFIKNVNTNSSGEFFVKVTSKCHEDADSIKFQLNVKSSPIKPKVLTNGNTLHLKDSIGFCQWFNEEDPFWWKEGDSLICSFSGKYYALVMNNDGCYAESEITPVIVSHVEEKEGKGVVVYQKPETEEVKIRTRKHVDRVEILDKTGKLRLLFKDTNRFNTSHLEAGEFVVRVRTGGQSYTKSLKKKSRK